MRKLKLLLPIILTLTMVMSITGISYAKARKSPPATPTNLKVSAITSSEVSLSWSGVTGATGYRVYMSTPDQSSFTLLATTSSTNYKHSGLKPEATYWYYVTAYNSIGASSASAMVSAATLALPVVSSPKYFLGFATYYYSGDSSSYNSISANASSINQIATDTYKTDGLGNITGLVPTQQISYANSNGIKVSTMITNNFDGNIAKTLLESPQNRQALINNILLEIQTNNYSGVNVDIEGIFAANRSHFSLFMSELYNKLNPLGYEVSVCVPAKTSDNSAYTWNYAYDYATLANYADRVVIMAYDEHYPGGEPGPIASIGWVQSVANYTATVIPKEKVLLGIAAYGYDWSINGTKAYSINGIYNLAATNHATINWDTTSQSPYFNYTDANGVSHSVWFENNTSVGYKLDIINNQNLSGAAMWRLGLENTDYWTTIKTKLNK